METANMLENLQDPMGVPFYPLLFQILATFTFALHIMFVNFSVGTISLALYGRLRGGDRWRALARSLSRAALPHVSLAIVTAVAPLLFIQVLYDPFWYTSSSLSAAWVIAFIVVMMIAYSAAYGFYLKSGKRERRADLVLALLALLFLLLAGVIIHVLNIQLLHPEKWFSWYAARATGHPSGLSLHAFQLARFLHFIIPALALGGIFLMLYAWYFQPRDDLDRDYLNWVGKLGSQLALRFTLLQAAAGVWWLLRVPGDFRFYMNPFFVASVIIALGLIVLLVKARQHPLSYACPALIAAFLTIVAMAASREALRTAYVGQFDYSIYAYKLNLDWASTLLFLLTFALGLLILCFLGVVAFSAGRQSGDVTMSPVMRRWGRFNIGLLIAWIAVIAALGALITVKNYL